MTEGTLLSRKNIKAAIQACQHTICVTDFGADPTGKTDSTTAIWQAFEAAKQVTELVVIDFPTGTYQLQKGTAQQREYHTSNTNSIEFPIKHIALLLEEQSDVIINGNGSLFMIHGDCMALAVVKSKNIHLYDFSWDFADPTTIEMTVSDVGTWEGGEYTDFYMPACFSHEIADNERDVIWNSAVDPTSQTYYWQDKNHKNGWTLVAYHPDRNITRRYALELGPFAEHRTKVEQLDDTTIRIYYDQNRPYLHKQGLVFEFCSTPRRETAGAFIWESAHTVIEQVHVHYMHAFGWLTQMSHHVSYYDCTFQTRPESERHTSGYADCIHFSGAGGHVHIEGCTFKQAHDDPINVHGTFTRVEEKIDDHTLLLKYIQRQQGGFPQYYVGNQVMFYRRDLLVPGEDNGQIYTVKKVVHPGEQGNDMRSMRVTFEEKLPDDLATYLTDKEPMFVAENITFTPSVCIKDNHFETISTRGILCTTRKSVLIEGNVFKHMAMDCIYLSNDSHFWYESGPIRNTTIRNNTFYVTKVGGAPWRNAAIRIDPITYGNTLPPVTNTIHKNIRIEENTFYMEHESVLAAKSVDHLTFVNNEIYPYTPARDTSIPETIVGEAHETERETATFELIACQHVLIANNRYAADIEPTLYYAQMTKAGLLQSDVLNIKETKSS